MNRKDIGIMKKDQTYSLYRVTNGRLNLKLNNNQLKSLNKLNGLCGINISNSNNNNKIYNIKEKNEKEDKDNDKKKYNSIKLDEEAK